MASTQRSTLSPTLPRKDYSPHPASTPVCQRACGLLLLALFAVVLTTAAFAQEKSKIGAFLEKLSPAELIPGADGFGTPQGDPPLVPVLSGGETVGYAYLTSDFVDSTGYSGKPIRIVAAIDKEGTILGAKLVEHHEPIVLIGIPEKRVVEFMAAYIGYNPIKAAAAGQAAPEPVQLPKPGK